MKPRFEMPVEQGYNLFLIDDYLRSLRSHEERLNLINTVGYSAEKREEFERSRGLPRGAVELALVCEDKQVQELNASFNQRLSKLQAENAPPEKMNELFSEIGSRAAGIRTLYPEAFQFLSQYTALAKRNASAFRGDYRFNNEYKILKTDCNPDQPCENVDVCVNINYVAFINVYGYVAVAAWVVAALFLAFAVYVWAAVAVIP